MVNLVLIKKSYAVIVISVLLAALFIQVNVASAAEGTVIDTGEVLVFLRDVVQIDTAKYEVRLTTNSTKYWPELGGVAQTTGQYALDSSGLVDATGECGKSILTVSFAFWDEELISCSFYEVSQGPPMYSEQPVADLSAAASGFLQRYQAYTGDAQLAQMRSLLDTVEVTSNSTKTVDNLRLEVRVENDKTFFIWGNVLNGTDYSRLRLEFQDGQFARFYDDRRFYKLGSSEVNISEEQAVSIALEHVENFSYVYQGEAITNLIINEGLIRAPTLNFLNGTDRFELYPCWIVDLPLDDLYPGDIAFIKVLLWADSGEVISAEALGYGFPHDPASTPPDSTQPDNNGAVPSAVYIAAACVAIAIPIAVVAVVLKKRRK